jgi:hypothetical protein
MRDDLSFLDNFSFVKSLYAITPSTSIFLVPEQHASLHGGVGGGGLKRPLVAPVSRAELQRVRLCERAVMLRAVGDGGA